MRCEECGRIIENEEMWRLGGDPNAPTSRSMLQMCWECRTRGVPAHRQTAGATPSMLSKTLIAEINEVVGASEPGAA